jgi:RNA polymerase sigma-B factor
MTLAPSATEPIEEPYLALAEDPAATAEAAGAADEISMFAELAALPIGPERTALRDRIVERHLPLVRAIAMRYRNRGEPMDDLLQAGALGLVKAVDRFEVERGLRFSTYAVPTVRGEIRRHFRDRGWAVHVARGLQEQVAAVTAASSALHDELHRAPTVAELAARTKLSEEQVLDALDCARSYRARSLNEPVGDADGTEVVATLGSEDPGFNGVVMHESLLPAVATLPPREQRILHLRFYGNQTQSQIAQQLGISQMHVSRLLAKALATLREQLAD